MPTRASRRKIEVLEATNNIAWNIVAKTTGERVKNPAAVALGMLGASKGGKARAKKLSRIQRKKIARHAAKTRWHKRT